MKREELLALMAMLVYRHDDKLLTDALDLADQMLDLATDRIRERRLQEKGLELREFNVEQA